MDILSTTVNYGYAGQKNNIVYWVLKRTIQVYKVCQRIMCIRNTPNTDVVKSKPFQANPNGQVHCWASGGTDGKLG